MVVAKRYLYLVAAILWGVPGISITIKGVVAYYSMPQWQLWWLLIATLCVIAAFFYMFRGVAGRYIARIETLPDRSPLYHTFPLRGWILLLFMMGLGIAVKNIPAIPLQFIASFYSGLGPMLILSSVRFVSAMICS